MRLCAAFPFFTIGMSLRALVSSGGRMRIFRRGKEDWTVVTKLAPAASDKLQKE